MLADRERRALLQDAEVRARRLGRPLLVSTTEPCAPQDILAAYAAAPDRERFLWLRPSSDEAVLGLGAAHTIEARDPGRFVSARRAWSELVADAIVDGPFGAPGVGPLLVGGFRFDPLRQPSGLWSALIGASDRLVVPARLIVQRAGKAWLTTSHVVGTSADGESTADGRPQMAEQAMLGPAAWQSLVQDVAGGIRQRRLDVDKVVLARARQVHAPRPFQSADVLRRLASEYPGCTVFSVAVGRAAFVGATPEQLVSVHDGVAATMALAGSFARGRTPDEDRALAERLLTDPKERAEHAFVADALRAALAEVCTRVVADAEPRLRQLPNVQHLLTPLRGQLAAGRTILDVVERLHPSPAVGGAPRARALDIIRQHEQLDRGLYAGPVGWLDGSGNGEFAVGIRSALLDGRAATLFAGCGIVADSDPAAEYVESDWKLQPMLTALGGADGA